MFARSRIFTFQGACFVAAVVGLASIPSAHAQQAFFMGLGDLPGGDTLSYATHMSADGKIVVGTSSSASHSTEAFRWTHETGMVGLGALRAQSNASRISDDGTTIVGSTGDNLSLGSSDPTSRAYRWTAENGMTLLPSEYGIDSRGINGDGSIIVGSWSWWSPLDGVHDPMPPMVHLYEVSSDGSVFTGYHTNSQSEAWSQQDGIIDLSPMTDPSCISADGKVITGFGYVAGAYTVLRWTKETGTLPFLDPLPNGAVPSLATGLSADGSVIVGAATPAGNNLYIWDAAHGTRNLYQLLVNEYGLGESLAGWNLRQGTGRTSISADGRTLAGFGINPAGNTEAWIAYLGDPVPEPSALALAGLALAPFAWRRRALPGHG